MKVLFRWRFFEIFSQGGDLESYGGVSLEDLLEKPEFEPDTQVEDCVVLDDVLVSHSSVVTEFCDGFSCCSDREYVEPQSFSFSKKRALCITSTQEEMRYESTQVKALPLSRRRMRPPTPLQNSNSSSEEEQERFLVEDQRWSAGERSLQARSSTWKKGTA